MISLTSDNRQTKGWLLHRRVWQQTLSVLQQTRSWSGNRLFFSVVVSTTEGLEIYFCHKAHSLQLEPDSRSLNLSKRNFNNALVSHPPIQSLMSTRPTNTSLKLKWLSSLSPFFQLEHIWLSPFKSLCLI